MSSHCAPLSPALEMTAGPNAPPPIEFCFDLIEPCVAPEPKKRARDTADNLTDMPAPGNCVLVDTNNPMDTAEDPSDDLADNINATNTATVVGQVEDLATSRKKGSFYSDKKGKYYTLEWPSFAEFNTWCWAEELGNSIELRKSSIWTGGALWTLRRLFRCGRHDNGSNKSNITNSKRKQVESKKIGCPCHIVIKVYPHTSTILGRYVKEHNHELRRANIKHTDVSNETREQVKTLLECKVDRWQIMSKPYLVHDGSTVINIASAGTHHI